MPSGNARVLSPGPVRVWPGLLYASKSPGAGDLAVVDRIAHGMVSAGVAAADNVARVAGARAIPGCLLHADAEPVLQLVKGG